MDVREKLINANELLNSIRDDYNINGANFAKIRRHIEAAPAVEDVEVVHGRWEEMHYEGGILDGTNFDRCSVCGYERVFDDHALKTVFKYCPNCGAMMDGGAD